LQIRGASSYAVYYSSSLPNSGGFQASPVSLPSDLGLGGSVEIRLSAPGEHSSFTLTYTPSYTGRVRYSSVNALNHALTLNATRRLAPQWTLGFSLNGNLSNTERFLFSPTTLGNVASLSANFNDLAGAVLSQRSANTELSSVLNTAPLVESPVRALLYGDRMFTSAVQTTATYSYSPRLSVTLSGGAARSQRVSEDLVASSYLIPTTTSADASVAMSYSLSPLTQVGGNVTSTRTSSSLYDAYTTTSTASLGRKMGRYWFWQIHGGIGIANPLRQLSVSSSPSKPHPVVGGSLGLRTFSHTVLASYDRTASDPYGLGASTNSSSTVNWRFNRPGSRWLLDGSVSWQQLQGTASQNTSAWRATAGFGRVLSAHLVCLTQYAYLSYSGTLGSSAYNASTSAVRVSLDWTAQPVTGGR
jgi:hypothetical protein